MAVSDFSWLKLASFIGALLLAVLFIASVAFGIQSLHDGEIAHGIVYLAGAMLSADAAWRVYHNYQKSDK